MSKYPGNIITTGADAGYSVYFDGTGDYLSTPSSASFSFGTGDFTIEYWVYATSGANNGMFQVSTNAGGLNASSANSVACNIFTTNSLTIYAAGSPYGTSSNKLPFNTWTHLAIVRASGVTKLYINGVLETSIGTGGSITDTTNYTGTYFAVGGYYGTSYLWNGYISNFRVLKGTALYTANFTPPTQLFNITNTSLLTCNSPAIVDQGTANSGSGFALTVNGNAAVSTFTPFTGYQAYNPALGAATPGVWTVSDALQAAATRQWNMYDPYFNYTTLKLSGNPGTNVPTWITDASTNNFAITPVADARASGLSPFSLTTYPNSGSGYFDGTGDYVSFTNNANTNLGTGDFTFEAWVYPTALTNFNMLFAAGGANNYFALKWGANSSVFGLNAYNGTQDVTSSSLTTPINQWTHVAFVRISGTIYFYINGVAAGSGGFSSAWGTSTGTATIGFNASYAGQYFINGYISNVRLVKGVGVYTGAFTTPTAPLTATQPAGTNISAITGTSTSLLTLQNSQSSNNNSFLDSSSNNFLITRNGNTTQGTFTPFSQTGWGISFNSSAQTDVLTAPSNAAYAIGTGNFTVDLMVNFAVWSATNQRLFLQGVSGTDNLTIGRDSGADTLKIWIQNTVVITYAWTPTIGQWYNIQVVRTGTGTNQVTLYINGVSVATGTSSASIAQNPVNIGGITWGGWI